MQRCTCRECEWCGTFVRNIKQHKMKEHKTKFHESEKERLRILREREQDNKKVECAKGCGKMYSTRAIMKHCKCEQCYMCGEHAYHLKKHIREEHKEEFQENDTERKRIDRILQNESAVGVFCELCGTIVQHMWKHMQEKHKLEFQENEKKRLRNYRAKTKTTKVKIPCEKGCGTIFTRRANMKRCSCERCDYCDMNGVQRYVHNMKKHMQEKHVKEFRAGESERVQMSEERRWWSEERKKEHQEKIREIEETEKERSKWSEERWKEFAEERRKWWQKTGKRQQELRVGEEKEKQVEREKKKLLEKGDYWEKRKLANEKRREKYRETVGAGKEKEE